MKENIVEMLQPSAEALAVEIGPTAEVLGSVRELGASKRWFNEGPRMPDIG